MYSNYAVEIEGLTVKFNTNIILEDINLKILKEEIFSLVGPNGCGKTTLLKTIMGFIKPDKGVIKILGKSPAKIKNSGKIGYLPQIKHYAFNYPVNVFDVVAMSRYAKKKIFEKLTNYDKEKITESIDKVGMSDYRNHHFGSLSGGQKQRVLIARALSVEPEILLLDEPSTGLDVVAQDSFYSLLVRIRDQMKLSVILVSHDIGSVSLFVDKIACLKKRIHFHGKPDECIPSHALEEVFGKNMTFLLHDKECETCRREK